MSDTRVMFAAITAGLEDMHGVAVEGRASGLTAEEGWALLATLRDGVQRISRMMADVALTLE